MNITKDTVREFMETALAMKVKSDSPKDIGYFLGQYEAFECILGILEVSCEDCPDMNVCDAECESDECLARRENRYEKQ